MLRRRPARSASAPPSWSVSSCQGEGRCPAKKAPAKKAPAKKAPAKKAPAKKVTQK